MKRIYITSLETAPHVSPDEWLAAGKQIHPVTVLQRITTDSQNVLAIEYDDKSISDTGIAIFKTPDNEIKTHISYEDKWWIKVTQRQFELLNSLSHAKSSNG